MSLAEVPNKKANITIIKIIKNKDNTIDNGIQRGAVTHHQDQSIFPVSFRTKKTINNTDVKLRPLDLELLILILDLFGIIRNKKMKFKINLFF